MADWTTTLQSGWYVYQAGQSKRWVAADNARPLVPANLRAGSTEVYLRVVNLRINNDRLYLNFASGQTGEDRADLSDAFETGGQIGLETGGTQLILDLSDSEITNLSPTGQDPYGYSFTGDTLTAFEAFRDALDNTSSTQEATLTLWDGQGDNPFASTPTLEASFAAGTPSLTADQAESTNVAHPEVTIQVNVITWDNFINPLQYREDSTGGTNYGDWTDLTTSQRINSQINADIGARYQFRDGPSGTAFPSIGYQILNNSNAVLEGRETGTIQLGMPVTELSGLRLAFRNITGDDIWGTSLNSLTNFYSAGVSNTLNFIFSQTIDGNIASAIGFLIREVGQTEGVGFLLPTFVQSGQYRIVNLDTNNADLNTFFRNLSTTTAYELLWDITGIPTTRVVPTIDAGFAAGTPGFTANLQEPNIAVAVAAGTPSMQAAMPAPTLAAGFGAGAPTIAADLQEPATPFIVTGFAAGTPSIDINTINVRANIAAAVRLASLTADEVVRFNATLDSGLPIASNSPRLFADLMEPEAGSSGTIVLGQPTVQGIQTAFTLNTPYPPVDNLFLVNITRLFFVGALNQTEWISAELRPELCRYLEQSGKPRDHRVSHPGAGRGRRRGIRAGFQRRP